MERIVAFLFFSIVLFCTFDACAEWDKAYATRLNNETRQYVNNELSARDLRIRELENKVEELSGRLEALDKWSREKWGIGSDELDKANRKINKAQAQTSVSLWLVVPLACALLAVMVFAFWPRRVVAVNASVDASSRPRCPRCGWEYDPGDTVCKNPACKTHF